MFTFVQNSWFAGHEAIMAMVILMSLTLSALIVGLKIHKYFKDDDFNY